jgi:hypothetical protein
VKDIRHHGGDEFFLHALKRRTDDGVTGDTEGQHDNYLGEGQLPAELHMKSLQMVEPVKGNMKVSGRPAGATWDLCTFLPCKD